MGRLIYDGPYYPPYKKTKADYEYEAEKNKLIPFAVAVANEEHGKTPGTRNREKWGEDWNGAFFSEMRRLCRVDGLNSF